MEVVMRKALKEYSELLKNVVGQMRKACNFLYRQVVVRHELPFTAMIPNKKTLSAIQRVRAREGLVKYDSFEDFKKEMDSA